MIKRKTIPDAWVNAMPNKYPVELACDISGLNTADLLTKLRNAQTMVDQEYDASHKLAERKNHIYHNTVGVLKIGDPVPIFDTSGPDNHLILFGKQIQGNFNNGGNKIGYCFYHEIRDSYNIYSKLSEILKVDINEFNCPHLENDMDVINIKQTPAYPYFNYSEMYEGKSDGVSCYLALSGDVTLSVRPYLGSNESYSAKLSSTKLTAYNPFVLHALTTTSEDAFILNIRFNHSTTFTKLLELTNSK